MRKSRVWNCGFNNKCFHFQIKWIISIIQCHGTRNDLARYGATGREQKNFQMKLKRYTLLLLEIYFFESLSKRNLWLTKFAPFIDLYFKSHKLSFLVGGGLEWQNVKYMSYNMYQVFESLHSNACLGLTCATSGLSTPWISIHFLSFLQWNFIGTKQWNNA